MTDDKILDALYTLFDANLRDGNFEIIDKVMNDFTVKYGSTDYLIAILTITLAAKDHLKSRDGFFQKVKEEIFIRGEWEEHLLYGLE